MVSSLRVKENADNFMECILLFIFGRVWSSSRLKSKSNGFFKYIFFNDDFSNIFKMESSLIRNNRLIILKKKKKKTLQK